jgi:glycosyltransferase involved in cell wall biosynthesis
VRLVELSRNFGQHIALSAGYHHARGEYVGMLNVDMEDPPDQIPLLLDEIRNGEAGMVYGLRAVRHSPWHTRMTSLAFNWVLVKLTGYAMPLNTATLRVMTRQFVSEYNRLTDEDDGNSSYVIDIPEGGYAYIVGNVLEKGGRSQNPNAISYAAERRDVAEGGLWVVNNTFYNRFVDSIFVANRSKLPMLVLNNVLRRRVTELLTLYKVQHGA